MGRVIVHIAVEGLLYFDCFCYGWLAFSVLQVNVIDIEELLTRLRRQWWRGRWYCVNRGRQGWSHCETEFLALKNNWSRGCRPRYFRRLLNKWRNWNLHVLHRHRIRQWLLAPLDIQRRRPLAIDLFEHTEPELVHLGVTAFRIQAYDGIVVLVHCHGGV